MTRNVGTIERVLRMFVGLILLGVAVGAFGPDYTSVWGWIGIVPLATGALAWCPAYTILGVNTCSR
jgi:Inner membrane protein YgaP-like, transmembrane domain